MNFLTNLLREGQKQEKQTKNTELLDIRGNIHRTIQPIQFRNARLTLIEVPPSNNHTNPTFDQESPFATWIVTIGKVRLPITTTTEIHPKPFQSSDTNNFSSVYQMSAVEPRRMGLDTEEKFLLTLMIDENGGYVQLKFSNEQSFQRWQSALCDALSDTMCGVAIQYTSSGRISTERLSQALTYCGQLSRPTLPSIQRCSQILSHRRQLSDLQLKLSLFLQQPDHQSSSSSMASSLLHSETSLDSLAETRRFGHHHITITQNDITPLVHAANHDMILAFDIDFEMLYVFAEKWGYKFTDVVGLRSDVGVRFVEEDEEERGGYLSWLSGGKSMSPYRFSIYELEELSDMFSRHQVQEDDDMDLIDVNLEESIDDDDKDDDEMNNGMGYFDRGNDDENDGEDENNEYDDYGSDDGSGEYKSPLHSPVKSPFKSPLKSPVKSSVISSDRSPSKHSDKNTTGLGLEPGSAKGLIARRNQYHNHSHTTKPSSSSSSSSSSWIRSLTGFAVSSAITTITTTASVAMTITAFAVTGVFGTVVGSLYKAKQWTDTAIHVITWTYATACDPANAMTKARLAVRTTLAATIGYDPTRRGIPLQTTTEPSNATTTTTTTNIINSSTPTLTSTTPISIPTSRRGLIVTAIPVAYSPTFSPISRVTPSVSSGTNNSNGSSSSSSSSEMVTVQLQAELVSTSPMASNSTRSGDSTTSQQRLMYKCVQVIRPIPVKVARTPTTPTTSSSVGGAMTTTPLTARTTTATSISTSMATPTNRFAIATPITRESTFTNTIHLSPITPSVSRTPLNNILLPITPTLNASSPLSIPRDSPIITQQRISPLPLQTPTRRNHHKRNRASPITLVTSRTPTPTTFHTTANNGTGNSTGNSTGNTTNSTSTSSSGGMGRSVNRASPLMINFAGGGGRSGSNGSEGLDGRGVGANGGLGESAAWKLPPLVVSSLRDTNIKDGDEGKVRSRLWLWLMLLVMVVVMVVVGIGMGWCGMMSATTVTTTVTTTSTTTTTNGIHTELAKGSRSRVALGPEIDLDLSGSELNETNGEDSVISLWHIDEEIAMNESETTTLTDTTIPMHSINTTISLSSDDQSTGTTTVDVTSTGESSVISDLSSEMMEAILGPLSEDTSTGDSNHLDHNNNSNNDSNNSSNSNNLHKDIIITNTNSTTTSTNNNNNLNGLTAVEEVQSNPPSQISQSNFTAQIQSYSSSQIAKEQRSFYSYPRRAQAPRIVVYTTLIVTTKWS